ncbi:hypothetical protein [Enterococcus gilvus]|uniref:hypothetical protein n=1 Tax=Enterococcus gilvus TaxID=160453 RepID=UPI003EDA7FC7
MEKETFKKSYTNLIKKESTNSEKPEPEDKKKRRLLFILFLLLLLLVTLLGIIFHFRATDPYDNQAVSYKSQVSRPTLKASEAAFPGFEDFSVTSPGKSIAVAFANPKFNSADLAFTVTTTQPKKRVLLKSKLVSPGKAILKLKTPGNGKKGYYPLAIKIQAYDRSKKHKPLNAVQQKIVLTIN